MTRKPMTKKKDIRRYLFAGNGAQIKLYNNISGNVLKYVIERSILFDGYVVHTDYNKPSEFHKPEVLGNIDTKRPWELLPNKLSAYTPGHVDWRVFSWLLRMIHLREDPSDDVEIFINSNLCAYCGKELTDSKSLKRGFGPSCWNKIMKNERKGVFR
jgi:hypothetical protein